MGYKLQENHNKAEKQTSKQMVLKKEGRRNSGHGKEEKMKANRNNRIITI
jgi:hypothetical protein